MGQNGHMESVCREAVARHVVDVQVCVDQMCHFISVTVDEVRYGVFLLLINHARVDYRAFSCRGVHHDVCVDSEQRESEFYYFHDLFFF
jgi:hypothetical protein